jgi:UDP-glucose 4-epimerase
MAAMRVLITGFSSFLGSGLSKALQVSSEVEHIVGVDTNGPPEIERTEFIRADIRNPLFRGMLASADVDVVVHTGPVTGLAGEYERHDIGTMQLLAACQHVQRLRKIVVGSSTGVYGSEPNAPSILTEEWSATSEPNSGESRASHEAESYVRDFARRRSDVTVTVLRMAAIVGPTAFTGMSRLFSLPLIPTALGFDPRIQLLHEDDAIEVLRRAVLEDHHGVFNVAAGGIVYLSQAIRLARRLPLPVPAPLTKGVGSLLRQAVGLDPSDDQLDLIAGGPVVDNSRLKSVFGYEPKYSTLEALHDFVVSRGSVVAGPRILADWERELYEVLNRAPLGHEDSRPRPAEEQRAGS